MMANKKMLYIILSYMAFLGACTISQKDEPLFANQNTIQIGLLLSETNPSNLQKQYLAAAQLAQEDFNQRQIQNHAPLRMELVKGTLSQNPDETFIHVKELRAKGVHFVVGPAESQNVIAIKEFAQANQMLVISNASTAPTLALEDDNIFRLVPNDTFQASLLAKQMRDDGMTELLIMHRKDLYGEDFSNTLQEHFENLGGTVREKTIYDVSVSDFEDHIQLLIDQIQLADPAIAPTKTGILLISFEEIIPIIREMIKQNVSLLRKFRFYGCDGNVGLRTVVADSQVAAFLAQTRFQASTPWILPSQNHIYEAFLKKLGDQASTSSLVADKDIFTATTYDAITLFGKTAESLKTQNKLNSFDAWKITLPQIAKDTMGITGNLELNAYGDRAYLPYALFGIQSSPPGWSWSLKSLETELVKTPLEAKETADTAL